MKTMPPLAWRCWNRDQSPTRSKCSHWRNSPLKPRLSHDLTKLFDPVDTGHDRTGKRLSNSLSQKFISRSLSAKATDVVDLFPL